MFGSPLMAARVLARQIYLSFPFPTNSCRAPNTFHEVTARIIKLRAHILIYVLV